MASIKQKAVRGIKWQVVNKVSQKFISVATFAVLARMLEPSVFGLFSMAFILIDGLSLFKSFGVDTSLVQKKDCPDIAYHTGFFLIQGLGVVILAICLVTAPIAGKFFNNAEVTSVIQALGVVFIGGCLGRIPQTILVKEMRFNFISVVEVLGSVTNSVAAILFALISPTVWSLVWAYLIKQFMMTVLLWRFSGYRLKWQFDKKIAVEMLHFGKFLVGTSLIWYLSANVGSTVIAKMLSVTALGYFSVAGNIAQFINSHFAGLIGNVMFPAYANLQHDKEAISRAFLKTIKYVSIFTFPFCVGLMLLAKEFTYFLYGEKWLEIVPLLQVMAISQITAPLVVSTSTILTASGHPRYGYRLSLIDFFVKLPLMIFFTAKWGVMGTCIANLLTHLVTMPAYFYLVAHIVDFKFKDFVEQVKPSFLSTLVMIAAIFGARYFISHEIHMIPLFGGRMLNFLTLGTISILAYAAVFFFLDRTASLEVKRMLLRTGDA